MNIEMSYAEEIEQRGLERGLKQGLEKGMKRGRLEGRQEGMERGLEKGKQEIARNLMKMGLSVDKIREATRLSEAELNALRLQ